MPKLVLANAGLLNRPARYPIHMGSRFWLVFVNLSTPGSVNRVKRTFLPQSQFLGEAQSTPQAKRRIFFCASLLYTRSFHVLYTRIALIRRYRMFSAACSCFVRTPAAVACARRAFDVPGNTCIALIRT